MSFSSMAWLKTKALATVTFTNKALRANDVTQCQRQVEWEHECPTFFIESHIPLLSILHSQIATIERIQYNIQDNLEENIVKLNIFYVS